VPGLRRDHKRKAPSQTRPAEPSNYTTSFWTWFSSPFSFKIDHHGKREADLIAVQVTSFQMENKKAKPSVYIGTEVLRQLQIDCARVS
jgi:hypothetical protein